MAFGGVDPGGTGAVRMPAPAMGGYSNWGGGFRPGGPKGGYSPGIMGPIEGRPPGPQPAPSWQGRPSGMMPPQGGQQMPPQQMGQGGMQGGGPSPGMQGGMGGYNPPPMQTGGGPVQVGGGWGTGDAMPRTPPLWQGPQSFGGNGMLPGGPGGVAQMQGQQSNGSWLGGYGGMGGYGGRMM